VPDEEGDTYIESEMLTDPWQHPYNYEPPPADDDEASAHVWSFGPDGQPGGRRRHRQPDDGGWALTGRPSGPRVGLSYSIGME
jgi:hypothetical protein